MFFKKGFQKKTASIALYSIKLSVFFINEAEGVYCAVRTGSLNATDRLRPQRVNSDVTNGGPFNMET